MVVGAEGQAAVPHLEVAAWLEGCECFCEVRVHVSEAIHLGAAMNVGERGPVEDKQALPNVEKSWPVELAFVRVRGHLSRHLLIRQIWIVI